MIQPQQESMNNSLNNALNNSLNNSLNNANTLALLNQLSPMNPFSSLATDMLNLNLNMWKPSPPNFGSINNLINQNMQHNDLASNILGMYTNQRPFQQNNPTLTSILPNSQNFLPEQNISMQNTLEGLNIAKHDSKKLNENSTRMNTEEKEHNVHKFIEKSIDQLIIPEHPKNTLQHAIVDTESGHIFFLSPVNKDNLPNNKIPMPFAAYSNMDIFGNSPALNNRNWPSPQPMFNSNSLNQLASLSLGRAVISPNLGLIQNSPDINQFLLNQSFNREGRSSDWTPDSQSKTPLSILNNKTRVISQMDNDKGIAPGSTGSVFSKRPMVPDNKSKNNSFSTNESSKFDSPSSFLESGNQARGLSFKAGDPAKVPVRQTM